MSHLVGMLVTGAVILVLLVAAGRSWGEALPMATLLACPLMMLGMMFMMGRAQGHSMDRTEHRSEDGSGETVDAGGPPPRGGVDG